MVYNRKNKKNSQIGAVLTEFVVAVPLILTFLTGILSTGRVLNQLSTISQAAFLGGMVGTQISSGSPAEINKIKNRITTVLDLQSRKLNTTGTVNVAYNPTTPVGFPEQGRSVKITVQGALPLFYQALNIDVEVTAPLLVLEQGLIDLTQPYNPTTLITCAAGAGASCIPALP